MAFWPEQPLKNRPRFLADLLFQLRSLKNLKYTKYSCVFQTFI